MLERKALFFRDSDPLEKIVNSTRRLAIALELNNWKIGWVWGPIPNTILNRIRGSSRSRTGLGEYFSNGKWINNRFWEYVPLIYKPYIRRLFQTDIDKLLKNTFPNLEYILRKNELYEVDVLCIASPAFMSALHICNSKLLIYHCPVPFWRLYKKFDDIYKANMKLLNSSNIIIVPSIYEKAELINKLDIDEKKIEVIEHGATLAFNGIEIPEEERSGIAVVGIPETTDINLIINLAKMMPDQVFKIIGPFTRKIKKMFGNIQNVKFLGMRNHEEVMIILNQCKVGLICYKEEIYRNKFSGNTLKLFDYAGAGLPVVSVPLLGEELNEEKGFIINAIDAASFKHGIEQCIHKFNVLSKNAKNFAIANRWEKRYVKFMEVINKHL